MKKLPYQDINIFELSTTLSGRLAGLLFADQGAKVYFVNRPGRSGEQVDDYLDRGKFAADSESLVDTRAADVVIVDGDTSIDHKSTQIVLRITAALPGDEVYGHLKADCSEDLLNATVGFFTDMAMTGRLLERPVIYTPMPLCSVYTGVNAAIAVAAALQERVSSGHGCEVIAARLTGGLSAIGAMAMTCTGLDPHLDRPAPAGLPEGMTPEQFGALLKSAAGSGERQLWLEHRLIQFGGPYRASDGRMLMIMACSNRRAGRKFFEHLGIWERLSEAGLVDVSPYVAANIGLRGRNIADAPSLSYASTSLIAEALEEIIATKTAAQWEAELCGAGLPVAEVMGLEEWMQDPEARRAGLTAQLTDNGKPQIGRSAWLASAQPYPPLHLACAAGDALAPAAVLPVTNSLARAKPLQGWEVVDLTNVIAGPHCARVMAELGATVYRVEQPDPNHTTWIHAQWGAEAGAGKRSIILDTNTDDGKAVFKKLLARADLVVINKGDAQCVRLGVDAETLHKLNRKAILVQLTAHNGERHSARHDYPGYDPVLQAHTGIMTRFGPEGCPTYHGLASCVDYLCGYLGAWAGMTALYAREQRGDGRGDWAQTSLAAAASLTQLLFQFQEAPAGVRGPLAKGPTDTQRIYKVSDGWIFAISQSDLTVSLEGETVESALARLKAQGIEAVRVNTVRELADRHRNLASRTIRFQAHTSDGLTTECFLPTWFCFNDVAAESRQEATRIGSNADEILQKLGYDHDDIVRFKQNGAVLGPEWTRVGSQNKTPRAKT